jgi:hypothetical protein
MSTNAVDPKQILMALLARRGGIMPQGGPPQGGMPSGTPPVMPQQPSAQPQQAPQQQQPQVQPQGTAPQLSPATPRGFEGTFGNRQGIISQIVNAAEKRNHDKKVNEAEMYYNQINSFLAAGDQESAHRLLDDNKVRKILKAGLDYQPLTEEPPPEAIGINKAQSKITQKQNMLQKIQQMVSGRGQQQQAPPGRAVIPGPSQAAQSAQNLNQAKVATEQAMAGKESAQAEEARARTAAIGPEMEAKKAAAQAEADRAKAEVTRAEAEAKKTEALTPFQQRESQAKISQLNALAEEAKAHARYFDKGGRLPGSTVNNLIKSARSDLYGAWKDAQTTKNKIHSEIQKQESGVTSKFLAGIGLTGDAKTGAFQADTQFNGLTQALKWWDGEGLQKIQNGELTPAQALAQAYKIAGIEAPPPSDPTGGGNDTGFVMGPDGVYQER